MRRGAFFTSRFDWSRPRRRRDFGWRRIRGHPGRGNNTVTFEGSLIIRDHRRMADYQTFFTNSNTPSIKPLFSRDRFPAHSNRRMGALSLLSNLLLPAVLVTATTLQAQIASDFTIVADTTNPSFSGFGGNPSLNNSGTVAFYAENPPGSGSIYIAVDGGDPVLISPGGNGAPSINEQGMVASSILQRRKLRRTL